MSPILACGQCADQSLFHVFPFLFYWMILFVICSLLMGPILAGIAGWRKEALPPLPHRYFLPALGLSLLLAPLTMGSMALPFGLAITFGLFKMTRSYRQGSRLPPGTEFSRLGRFARSLQRVYLTVCFLLIPVAYARLWWQWH
jgi:hypothetical protein